MATMYMEILNSWVIDNYMSNSNAAFKVIDNRSGEIIAIMYMEMLNSWAKSSANCIISHGRRSAELCPRQTKCLKKSRKKEHNEKNSLKNKTQKRNVYSIREYRSTSITYDTVF